MNATVMIEKLHTMKRSLTLLKMRGSNHDHHIRAFKIDGQGLRIGEPFRTVAGILAGRPVYVEPER